MCMYLDINLYINTYMYICIMYIECISIHRYMHINMYVFAYLCIHSRFFVFRLCILYGSIQYTLEIVSIRVATL